MPSPESPKTARLLATRRSLVERLPDLADRAKWQEFFDTYWRLIYGVARKAGLNDAEAQDVVQETIVGVARNIGRYDRDAGSFKSWLLQLTRWRIVDQLRKRSPADARRFPSDGPERETATIDRIPDPAGATLDAVWDDEWQRTLFDAAVARVKPKVSPKHFQIFDCAAVKRWPAAKVAAELRVNIAQVYLVKHRIAGLLKKEIAVLEKTR
jgi:RNA polymerase sigma factor (sigma-70 family)